MHFDPENRLGSPSRETVVFSGGAAQARIAPTRAADCSKDSNKAALRLP
ncbi:MAG: hypothetical protein JJE42_08035 [Burkholderiales bacterium]|nr:hypothetical protein [Burkholderiales bacterium]